MAYTSPIAGHWRNKWCCAGTFHERSQYFLQLWICGIGEVVTYTPLGLASNVNGPSLTNTQVSVQASACVNMCHNKELASYTRQT